MASILRYSVVAAFISSVSGFAISAGPSPTLPSAGDDFSPAPTTAPVLELVKAKLAKKQVTNYCTEWTIPGGYGAPGCLGTETCVFASTLGYGYEGCGITGVDYNWISECWNYESTRTGNPPVSEIYCPASAPYCGFFAFIFQPGYTYSNFGCSTISYAIYAELVSTVTASNITLASVGSSASSTASLSSALVITVTSTANPTTNTAGSSTTNTAGGSSSTSVLPTTSSHTPAKSNTGAIAGGVVGGIAAIAIAGFLIFWFCIRGRSDRKASEKPDAAQAAQTEAASSSAYMPPNGVAEIAGVAKPTASPAATQSVTTAPTSTGAPSPATQSAQFNAPSSSPHQGGGALVAAGAVAGAAAGAAAAHHHQQHSPQPSPQQQYPPQPSPQQYPPQQHPQQYPVPTASPPPQPTPNSQYSELASGGSQRVSQPPVSPVGTSPYAQSPPLGTSELAGAIGYQTPPTQHQYPPQHQQQYPPQGQQYPPQGQQYPPQGQQYPPQGQQYPPQHQQYPPQGQQYPPQQQQQQYPPQQQYPAQHELSGQYPPQEMSGNTSTRVAPPPPGPPPGHQGTPVQPTGGFDMSGNPTSEEFRGHELP